MPISKPIQHFKDGVKIGETPHIEQDDETRTDQALARLITGRSQLRQIRNQSQTFADGSGALTLAQLTTASRQLAGAVAVLAQTIMDMERVAGHQQDDGQE